MKKILFLLVAFSAMSFVNEVNGQSRAIGIRLGNNFEVSYQHGLSKDRFLEIDAGLIGYNNGVDFSVQHNWVLEIPVNKGDLNFYGGVGAGIGFNWGGTFNIGVVPQMGIEYIFESTPIQISIDYSPHIGLSLSNNHIGFNRYGTYDLGLAVRFMF